MRSKNLVGIFILLSIGLFLLVWAIPAKTANQSMVAQLQRVTGGKARISYHDKTGMVRFLGTDLKHPVPQKTRLASDATPEIVARSFLRDYGQVFGLANEAEELAVKRVRKASGSRSFVRFQQIYQGIPVLGGELIVQLDSNKNVLSTNGEILPDPALDTKPTVTASEAAETARQAVAKWYDRDVDKLTVTKPELWIYNAIVFGRNRDVNLLVWQMDVLPTALAPINELVLIDAHIGAIVLHFNQLDAAKDRKVHDTACSNTLPGTLVRSEGDPATGDADQDNAYDYSGYTYDFYWTEHGRDSINDAGMTIISTVDYDNTGGECNYANAFWNGSQMVYGTGYASACDVVGHELTHGVTQYESNLFYYMQSGAINESFSDIWGEFVELTYNAGAPADRWLLGEDLAGGAIRGMENPPAFGDPDRIGSGYYYCGEGDRGGVHTNSGVCNKAAYLLADGDVFNGYTVTALGINKTADLFYEVQTNLLTSASDYQDLYDALQQAAVNLGWSSADQQEVKDACDATEMDQLPSSCPAEAAPVCDSDSPTNLFFDDMENTGSGNWSSGILAGGTDEWYYPQTTNPYNFDATYATSGDYNIWGYNKSSVGDYYMAMTFDVALPAGASYLHFNHAYWFEFGGSTLWDGGVLEYSTDGGNSWNDAGSLITDNGYDGTISNSSSNPLGGRQAFGGLSNGYISSRLYLSSLSGNNVRFRFRIGTDSSFWAYGWFIDDFRIYVCGDMPTPLPTATPRPQAEIELNGSYLAQGSQFIAIFRLNQSIERPFTAFAVIFLPTGGVVDALTLSPNLRPAAVNRPGLAAPFNYVLQNTVIPPGAPAGSYEVVVAFFDPSGPITGRADAFLEASASFTVQ